MSSPINRLKYLKENCADPDTREALALAIQALNVKEHGAKMLELKRQLSTINPHNVHEYRQKIEECCSKMGTYPELLEFLPITLEEFLKQTADGNVFVKGDHTSFLIDNKKLKQPIKLCFDDGMGYCSKASYAFASHDTDGETIIWG